MAENTFGLNGRRTGDQAEQAGLQAEQGEVIFQSTPRRQPLAQPGQCGFIQGSGIVLSENSILIEMHGGVQLLGGQVEEAAFAGGFRGIEQMRNLQFMLACTVPVNTFLPSFS